MSRFSKLITVLAAIVAILAVIGISAISNVAEAGGQSSLRFDVNPGYPSTGPDTWNGWSHTKELFKATQPTEVTIGHWRRYVSDDPLTTIIGPDSTERTQVGDPSYFLYAHGVYLSYPEGTRNSFVSTQWHSTTEGCDTPRVSVSIKNPRSSSASAKAVIDNSRSGYTLFVTEDEGRTWTDIAIGDFYVTNTGPVGKIWVKTSPTSTVGDYSTYACSITHWNLTKEWIEGTTPTPTPSPTATPNPTPMIPVTFNLSPSSSTIEVGKTVDVAVKINSNNQKVGAVQAFIKFDTNLLEVVDMDPKEKGIQPKLGNCSLGIEVVNAPEPTIRYGGVSVPGRVLNCDAMTITFKGKKAGTNVLLFVLADTFASTEDGKTNFPKEVTNGQVTITNPSYVEFLTYPPIKEIKVGEIAEITLQLDSHGQQVMAIQALLKHDSTMLEVLDADPTQPGVQLALGNCPRFDNMWASAGENLFFGAANAGYGIVLNCNAMIIKVRGLKAGGTTVSFIEENTNSYDENGGRMPKKISDGSSITIK